MNERTRRLILFSMLPIVLVWGYFNLIAERPTPSVSTATPATEVATNPDAPLSPADTSSAPIDRIASEPWGTDPFRMGAPQREPLPTAHVVKRASLVWELNGIIYNESLPFAYVNHKSVKVGDIVNNATVVAIERKVVTLELDGRRFKISLNKDAQS